MANAAVASSTACIKEVQKLVDDPCRAPDAAQQAIDKVFMQSESPMPNAAWKKLVNDAQVRPYSHWDC